MSKSKLFNEWVVAYEAGNWKAEARLWEALGHLPVTAEVQALAEAIHGTPVETLATDAPATRAIVSMVRGV